MSQKWNTYQFLTFPTIVICEKLETLFVITFQQYHTYRWNSISEKKTHEKHMWEQSIYNKIIFFCKMLTKDTPYLAPAGEVWTSIH